MAGSKNKVLLLRLGNKNQQRDFETRYSDVIFNIKTKFTIVEANTTETALQALKDYGHSVVAVLAVDGGFHLPRNSLVHNRMRKYCANGGIFILCCLFASLMTPLPFNAMCTRFGLAWERGDTNRDIFPLSSRMTAVLGLERMRKLENTFNVNAVRLKNTHINARIYKEQSDTSTNVVADEAIDDKQSPAVYQKYGKGRIGYIGNVNNDRGAQTILMMLLGKFLQTGSRNIVQES